MRVLRLTGTIAMLSSLVVSAQTGPHEARAKEIFKQLVEINTTQSIGSTTGAAEAMAARLKAAGFADADVRVLGPSARKGNLVARFRGTGAKRPMILLAHLDVVEAKREDWSFDPFVLTEKDGHFYGRGTADDKTMAAVFVANLLRLKAEGFVPSRDIILMLTADEEGGPENGVKWLLANHRPLIDAEFAINEGGGGVMRKGTYVTNEVQAAEKVYQDLRLEIRNSGGHSSLPVKDNAIYRLAAGLSRLAAFEFPPQLNDITRAYFTRAAPAQPDAQTRADMLAVAKEPMDRAAAARLSAQSPYFNSMLRTTCVATQLDGGDAPNALPQLATANVNCRILPGVPVAAVITELTKVLADPAIQISLVDEATPSRPAVLREDVMTATEKIVKSMFPGVPVVPVMSTGATDGLYLRNAGIPTFGVDGLFDDIDDVRAHGRDERVGVKQFNEDLEFQYRLIVALSR
ncbi:MAG TPA: M20/M25/M40 family metallo-hydrolase [Gemmatimonadales bacterium]|nr:M20/M25/M40 family metallo-hydrolase [Gemmatimonadales bacterium]